MDEFVQKLPTWTRWALILPTFLTGYILVSLVLRLIWSLDLLVFPRGDVNLLWLVELPTAELFYAIYILFQFAASSFAAVWLAGAVAPIGQRLLAVLSGTILLLVGGGLLIFGLFFTSAYDDLGWWVTVQDVMSFVGMAVGVLIGAVTTSSGYRREEALSE